MNCKYHLQDDNYKLSIYTINLNISIIESSSLATIVYARIFLLVWLLLDRSLIDLTQLENKNIS